MSHHKKLSESDLDELYRMGQRWLTTTLIADNASVVEQADANGRDQRGSECANELHAWIAERRAKF
jgi:hypothetical protein